jgi:hypothetical protein
VEILRDVLADVAGVPASNLPLGQFHTGSTFVEFVSTGVVSVGVLLGALNFVLHQASVTIERVVKLKRGLTKLRQVASHEVSRSTKAQLVRGKLSSVMRTGAVAPALVPVRSGVRRYGKALVEMDERAEVRILTE